MQRHYLACDLGAESGRLIHGTIEDQQLKLGEIHRFPNQPLRPGDSIHWNISKLFEELRTGLRLASQRGVSFSSISCDSWGVDYLLFDQKNQLIEPTYHYRDPRTAQGMKNAFAKTDWPTIFSETGIQLMPLNSLFQLAAEKPERLKTASRILGVGDGFNFMLGGAPVAEVSLASTFQLYNPVSEQWSQKLVNDIGLPANILPPIVKSGTPIGSLSKPLEQETGLSSLRIIATCSHDTGAAVAAVPAQGRNWAFLSSGTWSLMGLERSEPILSTTCRELNFTNEIGYGDSVRLLKNISGLWLLQESKRAWAAQGDSFDYQELTQLAAEAPSFRSLIDPTDERFLAPKNMPEAIRAFCRETQQPLPDSVGAIARCVLESLALLYRQTLDDLQALTGDPIESLHIVGGGTKNALLNQFAANAIKKQVITGPVEATAAGNIIIQALAQGHLSSLADARALVRASHSLKSFEPEEAADWDKAYQAFQKFKSRSTTD